MPEQIVTIDLGFVNAYLLRARDGFILADTGLASQWARLVAALTAAGCAPGLLKLVVITHADMDHAGNARRLQAEWNAPVAVHGGDAAALRTGEGPKRHGRGPVSSATMGLTGLLRRFARSVRPEPLQPDFILMDGQSLESWGLDARVLHLPGHTPGSIALLTAGGALIAGDVFANRGRPDLSPFVESFDDYLASLEKAKSLAGSIKVVYPGHGRSFPGAAIRGIEL
jgi:hydroxyacylglutathione hydrolase